MPSSSEKLWTISDLLKWSTNYFQSNNIDSPRTTAEILLSHSLGIERLDLYLQFERPLNPDELSLYKDLIKRRLSREPVAYITGKKGFWSHEFYVSKDTLIPRPDTERIVEEVVSDLSKKEIERPCVLELGTGTGAIILSVAGECDCEYYASDISEGALKTAEKNSVSLGKNVKFFHGSWFEPFNDEKYKDFFDVIISNPPYIPTEDIKDLEPEITGFEPYGALDGGADGLDDLKYLIDNSSLYLKNGGSLYLEMGFDQGERLKEYASSKGCYKNIRILKDYGQNPRVIAMDYSEK